jgi:FtsP/CotA-like multicopper oxidase with cupredoxin domain
MVSLLGRRKSRREFLRNATLVAASAAMQGTAPCIAHAQPAPDYRLEISEIDWDLSPKKKIRTAAYNGQIPGPLLRLTEGKPVSIAITNKLDHPEIVHWHGQWIPSAVDGSMEEGSPMIPAGGSTLVEFVPKPAGLHWYHTHATANRNLKHGLYTGQFGILNVAPSANSALYDQEQFIVLHDWEPYYSASGDGSLMVNYALGSVNGRMLGHGNPIRVREGERVLFQILNASATEVHWLALPGHRFQVLALDGAPVATQAIVETLRLGPAERVTTLVQMNAPGVWVLGEPRKDFLDAGIGIVVEYAGRTGVPQPPHETRLLWNYRVFADATPTLRKPDLTIPLIFTSKFKGHGGLDQWMINGKSYPDYEPVILHAGLRHRLVFDNRSTDDHPVHLHRHNFELVSIQGDRISGVHKDVVVVAAGTRIEADLVANNPGNTLFHCHQQDHMDSGFMTLFRYA